MVKNPFAKVGAAGNKGSMDPWVSKIPWRRKMVIHPSILAGTIPWTEKPDGYSPWGYKSWTPGINLPKETKKICSQKTIRY